LVVVHKWSTPSLKCFQYYLYYNNSITQLCYWWSVNASWAYKIINLIGTIKTSIWFQDCLLNLLEQNSSHKFSDNKVFCDYIDQHNLVIICYFNEKREQKKTKISIVQLRISCFVGPLESTRSPQLWLLCSIHYLAFSQIFAFGKKGEILRLLTKYLHST
jgi:hypothetical protein